MIYWVKTKNKAELLEMCQLVVARGHKLLGDNTPEQYANKWPRHLICRYSAHGQMGGYEVKHMRFLPKSMMLTLTQFKTRLALADKPFVKSRPSFYMGFELEGCVTDDARDDLKAYVASLYPGHRLSDLIHHDGSIRPKCRGIEIVTPPMTANRAIEKLEWLLGMLSVMSDEGLFQTNGSCGLHVNLSESKSFDWPNADARHQFTYEFMKRFDPAKWLKTYRRTRNKYCWWKGLPADAKDVHRDEQTMEMAKVIAVRDGYGIATAHEKAKHWAAINTTHLNADSSNSRRIEVRVAGGKDYHADIERLRDFLLDIQAAASEAYGSI